MIEPKLLSILALSIVTTSAQALTTAEIIPSVASQSCMAWQVVGTCFWLKCIGWKCSVKTSTKVRHFIPETVVSSYSNTGENPWKEMSFMGSPISGEAEGTGHMNTPSKKRDNLPRFKNVDVIGHPGSLMNSTMSGTGYLCESATTAYMPYFLSTLDFVSWRWGLTESFYIESYTSGMREIGAYMSNAWGSVYPRQGFLVQPDDYKAAAVMAQRAADLTSRYGQPHLYMSTRSENREGYWPPGEVMENDITNHKWQLLHPQLQTTCSVFPNTAVQDDQGGYAWALWRPYRCCKKMGQKFLYSTGS